MNRKLVSGYPLVLGYLGLFLMMIGSIVLLPLITIFFYHIEITEAKYFILPGVFSIIIGSLLYLFIRGKEKDRLDRHQDAILILWIWVSAILVSSFPFILTGNYNFTQAIFEATSGFSTTGLTVVDVTQTTHIFLMFRSIMQFFGGVGLVLVLTSAISDRYGMRLYNSEGHTDKLLPNLLKSARLILSLYIIYILVGSIFYVIFGMPVFDAFNHAIASVSTGGFSTVSSSIGYYHSLPIEIITIVLMLLGSTNIVIHIFLLKGKFKSALKHIELKLLFILSVIFIPFMIIAMATSTHDSLGNSIRIGIFQFVTAVTTTGFQTVDNFQSLPIFFNFSVIILMIIGGGIGSTAGGIKQYRIVIAIKHLFWNFRDRISHKKTIHTDFVNRFGKDTVISDQDVNNNYAHIMMYLSILVIGTLIFTAYGNSLRDSLFEFSSALGTVGLSIGIIGYNSPAGLLWTSTIGMFLGRLEFYVVFIAITKMFLDLSKKKVL